jgi:hypothetical protein
MATSTAGGGEIAAIEKWLLRGFAVKVGEQKMVLYIRSIVNPSFLFGESKLALGPKYFRVSEVLQIELVPASATVRIRAREEKIDFELASPEVAQQTHGYMAVYHQFCCLRSAEKLSNVLKIEGFHTLGPTCSFKNGTHTVGIEGWGGAICGSAMHSGTHSIEMRMVTAGKCAYIGLCGIGYDLHDAPGEEGSWSINSGGGLMDNGGDYADNQHNGWTSGDLLRVEYDADDNEVRCWCNNKAIVQTSISVKPPLCFCAGNSGLMSEITIVKPQIDEGVAAKERAVQEQDGAAVARFRLQLAKGFLVQQYAGGPGSIAGKTAILFVRNDADTLLIAPSKAAPNPSECPLSKISDITLDGTDAKRVITIQMEGATDTPVVFAMASSVVTEAIVQLLRKLRQYVATERAALANGQRRLSPSSRLAGKANAAKPEREGMRLCGGRMELGVHRVEIKLVDVGIHTAVGVCIPAKASMDRWPGQSASSWALSRSGDLKHGGKMTAGHHKEWHTGSTLSFEFDADHAILRWYHDGSEQQEVRLPVSPYEEGGLSFCFANSGELSVGKVVTDNQQGEVEWGAGQEEEQQGREQQGRKQQRERVDPVAVAKEEAERMGILRQRLLQGILVREFVRANNTSDRSNKVVFAKPNDIEHLYYASSKKDRCPVTIAVQGLQLKIVGKASDRRIRLVSVEGGEANFSLATAAMTDRFAHALQKPGSALE